MKKPSHKPTLTNNQKNSNKKLILSKNDELDDPLPQKMDVKKIEKANKPEKLTLYELGDDQKNLRQKAFQMMKKKTMNKEDLNKLSKLNFDNEPLNKKMQETVYFTSENHYRENSTTQIEDKKFNSQSNYNNNFDKISESTKDFNMDVLDKFNQYYSNHYDPGIKKLNNLNKQNINNNNLQKKSNPENLNNNYYQDFYNNTEQIIPTEQNYEQMNNFNEDFFNTQKRNLNNYEIIHKYCLGINIDYALNKSFCFHKIQKWFAYIFDNKIIIEDFSNEYDRKQTFLEDSKYKLSGVKLSPNNNLLMAFSTNAFLVEKKKDKEFDFSDLTSYNVFEEESLNNNINNNDKVTVKIKVNPYIFIWDCKEFSEETNSPIFKNITKLSIKHNKILDCEFSPQNNLCVFSSSNNYKENFISVLDFLANEILVTTLSSQENNIIKFNPYLRNLEFTTLANKMFTFWRINLDASLQYQLGDFDKKKIEQSTNFTCMDYTPPLSNSSTVLLLICLSNFEVWGIDTKTNCLIIKYPSKYFLTLERTINSASIILIKENDTDASNVNYNSSVLNTKENNYVPINIQGTFRFVLCSHKFVVFVYANIIKVFKLPYPLSEIEYEKLNIFKGKPTEMIVDSDIVSVDMEILDNSDSAVCLTKKGNLWALNFEENTTIRIFSFQAELQSFDLESEMLITSEANNKTNINENNNKKLININQSSIEFNSKEKDYILISKIISKNYQTYSLKKIDFDDLVMEDCSPEVKENEHFYLTGHKSGTIKVWSLPEFNLSMNFEVVTEELVCFETTPNDLKLVASYKTKKAENQIPYSNEEKVLTESCIRFFDIAKEKFLGKYKPVSSEAFKHIKFLPDGNFFFAIDMKNVVFLIKIESYVPLLLQIHQIINFDTEVINFDLCPIDPYNKFLVNLQNVELHVFNRKFTNVLKNLSYDGSVPQFYLQDKFVFNEFFKNEIDNKKTDLNKEAKEIKAKVYDKLTGMSYVTNKNKKEEKLNDFETPEFYLTNFCFNDKNLVYILSHARKYLIVRNCEKHINLFNIALMKNPIDFVISPNSGYILILFKDKGIFHKSILEQPIKANISQNGKIIVLNSKYKISFFDLKYK